MVSHGLQNWSPVPEGNSEQEQETSAEVLTRPGPVARRIFVFFKFQGSDCMRNSFLATFGAKKKRPNVPECRFFETVDIFEVFFCKTV